MRWIIIVGLSAGVGLLIGFGGGVWLGPRQVVIAVSAAPLAPAMSAARFRECSEVAPDLIVEARAETVDVKYRGQLDLKPFACTTVERSSFIRRVCYDKANAYMLVSLNGTYYHYCDIDESTVNSFLTAASMGRYFNASIKGHFDCRIGHVPAY